MIGFVQNRDSTVRVAPIPTIKVLPDWVSRCFRIGAAAFLLPLLPAFLWWFDTRLMFYQRGWINIEYIALFCFALWWPSWTTVGLLTAEMCLALVEPVAHLYYFHPADVLDSLAYLRFLPPTRLAGYALLLIAYAAGTSVLLRWALGSQRQPAAKWSIMALISIAICAALSGLTLDRAAWISARAKNDIKQTRIVRAPLGSLLLAMHSSWNEARRGPGAISLPSTLGQVLSRIPPGARPNIVLVLTESWGHATDDRINRAETAPYDTPQILGRYRISAGTTTFDGPTTSGETRELCGNALGIASISAPNTYYASCWPAKLNAVGYHTVAVHGFTPTMFHRASWYRQFGFQQSFFQPELLQAGATMCDGAFLGICDADVADWAGKTQLSQTRDQPTFLHWVTLNSHLPLSRTTDEAGLDRCKAVGIIPGHGICSWFNLVLKVHESVAQLAASSSIRPTVFVIVGDHAPPFTREDLRARFSQTDVPYVILMPHSLDAAYRRAS